MTGRAKPGVVLKDWDYRGAALFDPHEMDAEVMRLHGLRVGPLSIAVRCGIDHASVLAILLRKGDDDTKTMAREFQPPRPSDHGRPRGLRGR